MLKCVPVGEAPRSMKTKGDTTDAAALPFDLHTGTPFVKELFRIFYCICGDCTSDKYFLYK